MRCPKLKANLSFVLGPPLSSTRRLLHFLNYTAMQYKASTITTNFPEKMAATAPVAIGTRGTVGSLVRKEIEYFTKFELDRCRNSLKPQGKMVDMASSCSHSRPSFWSLTLSWKKKKRRSSGGFLPSICSIVEVTESNQLNGIPGFSYRILKDDVKIMQA